MMTSHVELLKRLMPPIAYDINGAILTAGLTAEGAALDEVLASVGQILREASPLSTSSMLADWELEVGLSDVDSNSTALSLEQRRAALHAKITLRGGQSRAYFIAMANKLGFPVATISEFVPATCAGNCNDAIYSEADRAVWQLNLPFSGGVFLASCNSDCNSPLGSWGNAVVEATIAKFKPADTVVLFAYF